MAYNLLKAVIKTGKKTKAELTKIANVYLLAGQLSEEEYLEIVELINAMEK